MRQKKNGLENLVLITQLGLNVVTPVLICVLLGSWIFLHAHYGDILPIFRISDP